MSHALYRLGRFSAKRPWTVIGLWMAVALVVIATSVAFGRQLEDSFEAPGLDSSAALDLLTAAQSNAAGPTAQVVVTPRDDDSTLFESQEARAALIDLQAAISRLPNVVATSDPAGVLKAGSEAAQSGSVSADGRVAVVRVQYAVIDQLSSKDLDRLKALAVDLRVGSPLQIELSGDLFFSFEAPQTNIGEMIGLLAAVVILLLAFGSVVAMGMPIGLALFGLALGVSSMSLITYLIEIPSWAPQMASMVGLGVGIDYALFVVTRHREFLSRGMTIADAAGRAIAISGLAVIFAGGTVVIAILGLAVAGVPFMTSAGIAISVTVLVMVVASITLLPAFLGLAGHRLGRVRRQRGRHQRFVGHSATAGQSMPAGMGWQRWGRHVSKNAWRYAVGVTVALLAIAAPVLSLRLGFPDEGSLPESRTERRAYDLIASGFGPGINGPLVVAIDISADSTVVEPLRSAILADPGIAGVAPAQIDEQSAVAILVAFANTAPQDEATLTTIDRLRSEVFPRILANSPAEAHVGGQTATFSDIGNRVKDRLALFIAAVILLSCLLLIAVFRSVIVALKAALMNMLSIGAAYGVLVMVFQWGWGKDLIGLEEPVPILAFIPMFMFAILFGLSMDYEVFLLSRIREEYLKTGDNDTAVIHGIASTARVITSAALIMIAVFLGFVLGDDPATKMLGLGLATAIFVDATIVRMVLVPATMKLMGRANWWLPGWLDRLLPAIDVESESGLPQPEMETSQVSSASREEALV